MPQKQPNVGAKTAVVLENIQTVRLVQQCFKSPGSEIERDLYSLLNGFERRLPVLLPEYAPLKESNLLKDELDLRLVPNAAWEAPFPVAVSICMKAIVNPGFYDTRDNPYLGIYIADEGPESQRLKSRLYSSAPEGWERYTDDPSEYDVTIPIWRTIAIGEYAKGTAFDIEGFYSELTSAVRVAFGLERVFMGA